ncbi:ribokinase [uncultured Amnibacterium sp.]|uniref:ribokinase n=1 Tax=uncultured Amnibacterium sp. TaxID=1631851 RepID=UPI0035CBE116
MPTDTIPLSRAAGAMGFSVGVPSSPPGVIRNCLFTVVLVHIVFMRIAVVGGYGVATTYRVTDLPTPGATLIASERRLDLGGKGSNQAVGAARLGARVALLTATGDDEDGEAGRRLWVHEGVFAEHVVRSAAGTMAGAIVVADSGENQIVLHQGALSDLTAEDVGRFGGEIEAADVLLVSLEVPLAAASAALRRARAAGTRTVLNPAPATTLSMEVLASVDVLTPNWTEARAIAGARIGLDPTPDEVAAALHSMFGGALVITLGPDGALILEDGSITRVRAEQVDVVDTTGAGDAFNAAVAVGLAVGLPLEAAARYGCKVSAFVVQRPGVVPALPFAIDVGRPGDQR